MKTAIITGGLGFIGSHFVQFLLAQKYDVIIIDNLLNNAVEPNYFQKEKNCRTITKSIMDVDLSKFKKVDEVYHFASILGPVGVLRFGGDIGQNILLDSIKLRDFCIENQAKFINISSSEIYGQTENFQEDGLKIFPSQYQVRTEYGAAKMLAEICTVNKAKYQKLNYQIIRPFNVAGPRQKPDGGFVLPRFAIAALSNQPITVYGDGSQVRAFTHVIDICESIFIIAQSKYPNQIWNIGNPQNQMSILNMAKWVKKLVKLKNPQLNPKIALIDPIEIHGQYFAEVPDKLPNIDKLKTKLGWEPKYDYQTIFNGVIDFYSEKIKNGYYYKVV